jgi:ornithine--oxo-acid transaminase
VEFASMPGRAASEYLAGRGVLVKDTHGTTIRLAPPLTISQGDLDWALDRVEEMLRNP